MRPVIPRLERHGASKMLSRIGELRPHRRDEAQENFRIAHLGVGRQSFRRRGLRLLPLATVEQLPGLVKVAARFRGLVCEGCNRTYNGDAGAPARHHESECITRG